MEKQKLWTRLSIGMIFVFLFAVFIGNSKVTDLRLQEKKNATEISEMKAQLEESDTEEDYTAPSEVLKDDEKKTVNKDCKKLGDAVAKYQNIYASLDMNKDSKKFDKNVKALDQCFTDSAKSARVPWYNGTIAGTWSFLKDGTFSGTKKNVLWLCRASDGALLAYAKGAYDSESKKFTDMHYEMSFIGSGSVDSSGTAPEDHTAEDVSNITNSMENADVPEEVKSTGEDSMSDEDLSNLRDAQWQLKESLNGGDEDAD